MEYWILLPHIPTVFVTSLIVIQTAEHKMVALSHCGGGEVGGGGGGDFAGIILNKQDCVKNCCVSVYYSIPVCRAQGVCLSLFPFKTKSPTTQFGFHQPFSCKNIGF